LLEKDPAARPSIDQTRGMLRKAAAERPSATVTVPVAAVGALDRGGRTQAVPVDAAPAAAAASPPTAARFDEERRTAGPAATSDAPLPPQRPLWEEDDRELPPPGRSWTAILVGLTSLLLLSGLAFVLLRGDGAGAAKQDTGNAAPKAKSSQKASATPSETTKASQSPTPTESEAPSSSAPATTKAATGGAPEGYRSYTDPSGFTVAIPEGWRRVQRSATAVDFREPGGFRYLRVDQTNSPKDDPVADWTRQEASVRQRLSGYQRIRIVPVDYRDYKTADWEFTYSNTHVLNRGMNTGAKGYALYWSTPKSQWNASRPMFDVFARTFRPAG
jgi:hypothetical protein